MNIYCCLKSNICLQFENKITFARNIVLAGERVQEHVHIHTSDEWYFCPHACSSGVGFHSPLLLLFSDKWRKKMKNSQHTRPMGEKSSTVGRIMPICARDTTSVHVWTEYNFFFVCHSRNDELIKMSLIDGKIIQIENFRVSVVERVCGCFHLQRVSHSLSVILSVKQISNFRFTHCRARDTRSWSFDMCYSELVSEFEKIPSYSKSASPHPGVCDCSPSYQQLHSTEKKSKKSFTICLTRLTNGWKVLVSSEFAALFSSFLTFWWMKNIRHLLFAKFLAFIIAHLWLTRMWNGNNRSSINLHNRYAVTS